MTDMNILDLFLKASLLVKLIMLILIGFSIASWAIIIQRTRILNAAAREAEAFEDKFWSGIELSRLYQESQGRRDSLAGSEQIFYSGFKEFVRLHRAKKRQRVWIPQSANPRPFASVINSRDFSSKTAFISSISLLSAPELKGKRNRTAREANGFLRETIHARSTVL